MRQEKMAGELMVDGGKKKKRKDVWSRGGNIL